MTPTDLAALIRAAATDVLTGRGLGTDALPVEIDIARPRNPAHGDYATSVALRTAKRLGVAPRQLAGWLVDDLGARAGIATAEVAGPGFVNLRLAAVERGTLVGAVLAAGPRYGTGAGPSADPGAELGTELGTEPASAPVERLRARVAALAEAGPATRIRTRTGTMITMSELVAAVGEPVARYALARTGAHTLDVDLDVLVGESERNPAHRVRLAHARLCALARQSADLGLTAGQRYDLLEHPREGELIRTLGEYPDVVRAAAQRGEPPRVARYLETMSTAYDRCDNTCRVLPMGDEPITELHRARLALASATRRVLANGLDLVGVSAPERM
ncbi:MAG TPA: DALR anticodon-binding domain-containing protein [Pseudonocardia sp.]|nr:DALR anticodon-binding domain-containing protein [Pseudonocardia sp.]